MKKYSQMDDDYSVLSYKPQLRGKTLEDLYLAIMADPGLPQPDKSQLVSQVKGMVGFASSSTPISTLMARGLGGMIGWLISKYFGMGPVGQLISSLAGFGLGNAINNQLNKPPDPYPGFKLIGG